MRSANQLWSAALGFADRDSCASLRPVASAGSALKRAAAQANGSPVAQLRLLDDAFFARAEDMSTALPARRAQLLGAVDGAAARVRTLGCLADYELRWDAIEPAGQMRERFMAITGPPLARLRAAIADVVSQFEDWPPARQPATPAADAEIADLRARHAINRAVRGYLSDVAGQHRRLLEDRDALARIGVALPAPWMWPPAITEPDWLLPRLRDAVLAAANEQDSRRSARAACDEWFAAFDQAITAWCRRFWELSVADYMASRDAIIAGWRAGIADAVRSAEAGRARAIDRVAELDAAEDRLRQLRRERDGWHAGDRAGLTPATRAAFAAIRQGMNGDARSWLLDRLDALATRDEAEVLVPVVATMKAGKSTVLGAMLGHDIAPRRSHTMTAVATRYAVTTDVKFPELRLDGKLLADCERFRTRVRARLAKDGAALAGYPHLGRFARQLDGQPLPLSQYCHGGEAVLAALTFLNDLARVAILLLPAKQAAAIADWTPEVLVPSVQATAWRVTLVDTPGLGEAMGKDLLAKILDRALRRAHACVLILNYEQLDTIATVALAEMVARRFRSRTTSSVWVVVNRIDQRQRVADPDKAEMREIVGRLLRLAGEPVPVVETRADLAIAAAVCETSTDPERYRPVLALADPHGALPDDTDRERLLRTAIRKSGLDSLRQEVFGDVRRRAAGLALDRVIAELPATALDELRWALSLAATA